jgi:hypothetical protein
MKNKFIFTAGLVLFAGMGLAFAGADAAVQAAPEVKQENPKVKEFKDILFKLVRQDEYLDEAIETLDTAGNKPGVDELSALRVSLRTITGNLRHIAALNKKEFSTIEPGTELSTYTNTIMSYSRKVNRKVGQVNLLVGKLAAQNKKAAMRDAVASRKGGKKARGRKIADIVEEQKAMEALSAELKSLGAASRNLNATSKWLYIASK